MTEHESEILHLFQVLPEDAQSAILRVSGGLAEAFPRPLASETGLDFDREAALAEELAELRWAQRTRDRPCIGCSACGHCTLLRLVEDLPSRPLILWCPACLKLEAVALDDASPFRE